MASSDYRERIYEHYATRFQDASEVFDEATARRWGHLYRQLLRGWLPKDHDAKVLDLGCGGGRLLHMLRELGYRNLQGVDASAEQVRIARQVTPEIEQADVLGFLEAHENQYDWICGFDIIEHLHKPEVLRFLDAAQRALRSGGRLVLHTPNADSPWAGVHNDFTHEVEFNANTLGRLLVLAGFSEIEAREVGPAPRHSVLSALRYPLWKAIRLGLRIWNLAETGGPGSGIFTRVFLISAVRR